MLSAKFIVPFLTKSINLSAHKIVLSTAIKVNNKISNDCKIFNKSLFLFSTTTSNSPNQQFFVFNS